MRRFDLHQGPDPAATDFGLDTLRTRLIRQQEWADAANQAATAGLVLGFLVGVFVALFIGWAF